MEYKNRNQAILKEFEKGNTLRELGRKFNISYERVRQILKKLTSSNGHEVRKQKAVDFHYKVKGLEREKFDTIIKNNRMTMSWLLMMRGKERNNVKPGGAVFKGFRAEEIVSNLLSENGIENELMPNHCIYDILVNKKIKVDVKAGYTATVTSERQISPMYRFAVKKRKKGDYCDFFIFYIPERGDLFVIPNSEIGYVDHAYISYPTVYKTKTKWQLFKDRYDLLLTF